MPGLTLRMVAGRDGGAESRFRKGQRAMTRGPRDVARVECDAGGLRLGYVAYPGYPITVVDDAEFRVVLEGRIYDRTPAQIPRELTSLFRGLFASSDPVPAVSDFLRGVDGEFVAAGASRDGMRCIVFTDSLGRLPLYYSVDGGILSLAREAKFIAAASGEWRFDRLGVAQHLWVGYPYGDRTLWDGVLRAPEGFVADARSDGNSVSVRTGRAYAFRCDDESDERRPRESAAELAQEFVRATGARACGEPTVLSLSGGYDSRAVLAALVRSNAAAETATFRRANGVQAADARIAGEVAEAFRVPWHCIDLAEPTDADARRLVWMKDGLNYTAMAFIIPFLDETVRRWGKRAVMLTGDGGDKVFPDLRPRRHPKSLDDLAGLLIEEQAGVGAELVEELLGLPRGTLRQDLRSRLEEYPESTLVGRGIRWKIAERSRKWLFEGEDRNRCVLWESTPFYDVRVFERALRVRSDRKAHFRFYREFQRNLSPALLSMRHSDAATMIGSPLFQLESISRAWARRAVGDLRQKRRWRLASRAPKGIRRVEETASEIRQAAAGRTPLSAILRVPDRAADFVWTPRFLEAWRTVSMLDDLWSERLTAETPAAEEPA